MAIRYPLVREGGHAVEKPAADQLAPNSWTTAGRPSSPPTGLEGFNTTLGTREWWNGTHWVPDGWIDFADSGGSLFAVSSATISGFEDVPWIKEISLGFDDMATVATVSYDIKLHDSAGAVPGLYRTSESLIRDAAGSIVTLRNDAFSMRVSGTDIFNGEIRFTKDSVRNKWAANGILFNSSSVRRTVFVGGYSPPFGSDLLHDIVLSSPGTTMQGYYNVRVRA